MHLPTRLFNAYEKLKLSNESSILDIVELVENNSSHPESIPKAEKIRRRKLKAEQYFARLLLNGQVVGDTKVERLDWPSFTVQLGHRFSCTMPNEPPDICIQIWKSSIGFVPDTLVCTCFQRVEPIGRSQIGEDRLQFSSNHVDLQRRWKGTLVISSSYSVQSAAHSTPSTTFARTHRQGYPNFHQQHNLIRPPRNGPGDQNKEGGLKKLSRCLRTDLDSMMAFKMPGSEIPFGTKTLAEPLRHKLIRMRNNDPSSIPSPIPPTERQGHDSKVYHDLLKNQDGEHHSADVMLLNDAMKECASEKMQHIAQISQEVEECPKQQLTQRRKHHLSEMVQDVGLLRFNDDDEFEIPLPPRKRSFFPQTTKPLPSTRTGGDCKMFLTISSGLNVPVKIGGEDGVNDEASGIFIMVRFNGQCYLLSKAATSRHTNPQWKDIICIPLRDVLDGSSSALSRRSLENESIDLFLFDSSKVDMRSLGGFYDDEDTKASEHQYLVRVRLRLSLRRLTWTLTLILHSNTSLFSGSCFCWTVNIAA